ncbi:TonB-dependent receptor [Cellvibrio mixtus]|uniref:TonB-dependent receptor n=1 Tax=Cellvibrio mixtus TaxID=39650 RepID=UPI000693A261|nr:TonB-dependent receptor [Cellvibrio mixtus]
MFKPLALFIASVAISSAAVAQSANTDDEGSAQNSTEQLAAVEYEAPYEAPLLAANTNEKVMVLNVVTVRSRNRIEKLQDVPLSVSVVQGKELERLNATDIAALTQRLANISWNQGNQRTSSLSIRGIGKQGQTEAQDPAVGLIVDGVNYAYNALSSSFDFTDVETVEVARGPQGTLLGKNSSIGAINVTTKRPSFDSDFSYALTLGEWDTVQGRFAGGGAVVDNLLAWRGSLSVSKGQGDLKNAYNTDETYTNKERVSGRVQFLLTPNEDFSARLAVDIQPRSGERTNGRTIRTPTPATYSNGSINPLSEDAKTRLTRRWFTQSPAYNYTDYYLATDEVNNDSARPLITGSNGATVDLNWKLDSHTITSITAYKDYHFNAVNDEGTPFDIQRNSGGFFNDYKQVSQEVRLSSAQGGFVDYQTGLYYLDVNNKSEYQRIWGNDAGAWFASNAQYTTLDKDGAGRYLLINSLSGLDMAWNSPAGYQDINNESIAAFGQANWNFTDKFVLTTGLRFTREERDNRTSTHIVDSGFGAELNPSTVNDVNLGGFHSVNATTALNATTNVAAGTLGRVVTTVNPDGTTTKTLVNDNSVSQLKLADFLANKYFGTTIADATPGSAYNSLTAAQKAQVGAAKALRQSQIGVVFNEFDVEPYEKTLPAFVISPTYKFNENLTTYFSWQHGEKAGIAQATNGISNLVKEEKNDALELGLKSLLLNNTLVLNLALFEMNIKDYQQTSRIFDEYSTTLARQADPNAPDRYTNATANIPKVRSRGLEIDSIYSGIPNTTLRFAGAYTDSTYEEFTNSAQPSENGYTGAPPYQDVSGETLPGASKVSFNLGVDYRLPVFDGKEFHTSLNAQYNSKFNSDNSLSSYGWIEGRTLVDFGIGLGNSKQTFDVNLVVKNLFDDDTPSTRTWNSYTPATPRWIGVTFSGRF